MQNSLNCIFCKILLGKLPSTKIYEDKKFYAFLALSPFSEGHTLVIPKKHYSHVWEYPDIEEYFSVAKKIVHHYLHLNIIYVDLLVLGRRIPHAHIHLVPHNGTDPRWNKVRNEIKNIMDDKKHFLTSEQRNLLSKKFKI